MLKRKSGFRVLFILSVIPVVALLSWLSPSRSQPIIGDPIQGANDSILGSKHDFTGLNQRAGVSAMPGLAFSDFGNPCIYCHIPPEQAETPATLGGIKNWNRYMPAVKNYQLYNSQFLQSKTRTPSPISLLCLSCHDGTMAVDMVIFKPNSFDTREDVALHMRINGASNLTSCGRCHNGLIAHDIAIKQLGTDLRNDHPISMPYAGFGGVDPDFREPENALGFRNGVKLYDGRVECATCHNVHNPSNEPFLRTRADFLCQTCHIK